MTAKPALLRLLDETETLGGGVASRGAPRRIDWVKEPTTRNFAGGKTSSGRCVRLKRLPNGNTLITEPDGDCLFERKGKGRIS